MTARKLSARPPRWLLVVARRPPRWPPGRVLEPRQRATPRSKIPQYGVIDPHQPRELQMVSLPPYVVEPPDELEISVRPAVARPRPDDPDRPGRRQHRPRLPRRRLRRRPDPRPGRAEDRPAPRRRTPAPTRPSEPYQVSVRLVNGIAEQVVLRPRAPSPPRASSRSPATRPSSTRILTAGLRSNSLPEKAYLVRPHPAGGPDQILKIDWFGIKDRGDTLTNYQVFPGDRIIVPGGKPPGLLSTLLGG